METKEQAVTPQTSVLAHAWRLLTTSRYTRKLEEDNAELKRENRELKAEGVALAYALTGRKAEVFREQAVKGEQSSRLPRRVSFSQAKRKIEQDIYSS